MDCSFLSIDKKRRVQHSSGAEPLMHNSLRVILSFVPVTLLMKATLESMVEGVRGGEGI